MGYLQPPLGLFTDQPATQRVPTQPTTAALQASGASAAAAQTLISRYNLQARLAETEGKGKGKAREEDDAPTSGWATSAAEREKNLKERKARMVLEARKSVFFNTLILI